MSWEPTATGELAAHQTLESLLSVVASLTQVPATTFTAGPLWNESYAFGVEDPYQQPPLMAAGTQAGSPVVILDVGDGRKTSRTSPPASPSSPQMAGSSSIPSTARPNSSCPAQILAQAQQEQVAGGQKRHRAASSTSRTSQPFKAPTGSSRPPSPAPATVGAWCSSSSRRSMSRKVERSHSTSTSAHRRSRPLGTHQVCR